MSADGTPNRLAYREAVSWNDEGPVNEQGSGSKR